MRVRADAFYKAIDQIQEAALEPALWPATLDTISAASGALGINIMAPAGATALDGVIVTESLSRVMEDYLDEEWHTRDFRAQFRPLIRRSGVVLEQHFASQNLFDNHDYYKFMAQYRMRYTAMLDFSCGGDELYFVLQREIARDCFSAEDMPHFHALRSRLTSAAQMMKHMSTHRVEGMSAAFGRAGIACIFFDDKGRVTLVNPKAEALLTDDLKVSRGEIRTLFQKENVLFQQALKTAIGGTGPSPEPSPVVRLSRKDKRPLAVRFERLGTRLSDMFPHSRAMALIDDLDEEPQQHSETLVTLFDLSPSEVKTALLLAKGMGAVDIAAHRGISYETVRSHIKSIFRKTDTGRQSEISALFGRIRF